MHWTSFDRATLLAYRVKLVNFPVDELKDPAGYGANDTRAIHAALKHERKSKRTKFVKMTSRESKQLKVDIIAREEREKVSGKREKVLRNTIEVPAEASDSDESGSSEHDDQANKSGKRKRVQAAETDNEAEGGHKRQNNRKGNTSAPKKAAEKRRQKGISRRQKERQDATDSDADHRTSLAPPPPEDLSTSLPPNPSIPQHQPTTPPSMSMDSTQLQSNCTSIRDGHGNPVPSIIMPTAQSAHPSMDVSTHPVQCAAVSPSIDDALTLVTDHPTNLEAGTGTMEPTIGNTYSNFYSGTGSDARPENALAPSPSPAPAEDPPPTLTPSSAPAPSQYIPIGNQQSGQAQGGHEVVPTTARSIGVVTGKARKQTTQKKGSSVMSISELTSTQSVPSTPSSRFQPRTTHPATQMSGPPQYYTQGYIHHAPPSQSYNHFSPSAPMEHPASRHYDQGYSQPQHHSSYKHPHYNAPTTTYQEPYHYQSYAGHTQGKPSTSGDVQRPVFAAVGNSPSLHVGIGTHQGYSADSHYQVSKVLLSTFHSHAFCSGLTKCPHPRQILSGERVLMPLELLKQHN